MKIIILSVFTFFILQSKAQTQKKSFVINGKIENIKSGIIYLIIYENNKVKKDSSKIINGKYTFKGSVTAVADAILDIKDDKQDYYRFFIENTIITIKGKGYPLSNWQNSGSKLNDDDAKLKTWLKPVEEVENVFDKTYEKASENKDQHVLDSLDEAEFGIREVKRNYIKEFIKLNPKSLRSAIAISENYAYYAEADEVAFLYNLLDENIKNTENGIAVKKMLDVYKTVAVGQKAPNIIQKDTADKDISLASLKGKYIMVDFWASWCGPCRRENPNIVKAYTMFKNKGFDVFAVSYDKTKSKWTKAIISDSLVWNQVSDLKGWENATSELYYIKAIPANLLLDKEGKIIAKNLFGNKLIAKLVELMPN